MSPRVVRGTRQLVEFVLGLEIKDGFGEFTLREHHIRPGRAGERFLLDADDLAPLASGVLVVDVSALHVCVTGDGRARFVVEKGPGKGDGIGWVVGVVAQVHELDAVLVARGPRRPDAAALRATIIVSAILVDSEKLTHQPPRQGLRLLAAVPGVVAHYDPLNYIAVEQPLL